MTPTTLFRSAAVAALVPLLAAPALAQSMSMGAYGYAPVHADPAWHVNLTNASGKLVNVSPVAARVRFADGRSRIFEISHGQYERLRSMRGAWISFDVRHDVLRDVNDMA
ncbi:MAG TPA: hypothetical protein VMD91_06625 [Candidatus Sulfotelmatobacter sp.]|nr:hypothetical protein [Candidatus Sulfotelmatobacter sp.]